MILDFLNRRLLVYLLYIHYGVVYIFHKAAMLKYSNFGHFFLTRFSVVNNFCGRFIALHVVVECQFCDLDLERALHNDVECQFCDFDLG